MINERQDKKRALYQKGKEIKMNHSHMDRMQCKEYMPR